jgi:uncharacterized phiE125 gp8 family phage protein
MDGYGCEWTLVVPDRAVTVVSSSVAAASVITTDVAHGLATGDTTTIAGHVGSTPAVTGSYVVTVLTPTTFSIPLNVSIAGTGGTVTRTTAVEPLTLAEVKAQCHITHSDEDALLTSYLVAARQAAEAALSRGLLSQTWLLTLPAWDESLWLPMAAPLQAVVSVKYYDTAGALTTLASTVYTVDAVSRPGRLLRAAGQAWPSLQSARTAGRIEVLYVAGWTSPALVPERIKQGIRSHVSYLDCDREGLEESGAAARAAAEACWTDRVYWRPPSCALM